MQLNKSIMSHSICWMMSRAISSWSETMDTRSLMTVIPFNKITCFTDGNEVQSSATSLGYVAHTDSRNMDQVYNIQV
ncbi:hypothetical protein CTI12_AA378920 [Artemisia annua]|uniref:Uncharacterized protein n=1 Tax=Artemisia annua TaxID=35608 RepID=A0A2U1MK03_ARTAN|nr:hypothetical protein CTI12_AA378920 [Artemisia annua]